MSDPELLFSFVEWYNDWLFKKETDRVSIREPELQVLNGLCHFAKKMTPDAKGEVELNLNEVQNDSMRELKFLLKVEEVDSLIEKKMIGEKFMKGDALVCKIHLADMAKIVPYWRIIFALKKIHR